VEDQEPGNVTFTVRDRVERLAAELPQYVPVLRACHVLASHLAGSFTASLVNNYLLREFDQPRFNLTPLVRRGFLTSRMSNVERPMRHYKMADLDAVDAALRAVGSFPPPPTPWPPPRPDVPLGENPIARLPGTVIVDDPELALEMVRRLGTQPRRHE
jgi:hypothetical protein